MGGLLCRQPQGLNSEDGQYLVDAEGQFDIASDWNDVIARQQAAIDLLALNKPPIKAEDLLRQALQNDRRKCAERVLTPASQIGDDADERILKYRRGCTSHSLRIG